MDASSGGARIARSTYETYLLVGGILAFLVGIVIALNAQGQIDAAWRGSDLMVAIGGGRMIPDTSVAELWAGTGQMLYVIGAIAAVGAITMRYLRRRRAREAGVPAAR